MGHKGPQGCDFRQPAKHVRRGAAYFTGAHTGPVLKLRHCMIHIMIMRVRIGDITSSFLSFLVLSSVGSQSFFAAKESKSWCEFSPSNTHDLHEQSDVLFGLN
jgi:hypothetical protein